MKIRTKILIPPAAFVSLLCVVLAVFFVLQKKQQELLLDITSDLQQANALSSELIILYLNNKNHVLRFRYGGDEMQLAHIKLINEGIEEKLTRLKDKKLSNKSQLEFERLLESHQGVRAIQDELITVIQKNSSDNIGRVLNRYFLKINQMEAVLADFSAHRFHELNFALLNFQQENNLYEPMAVLMLLLSLLMLLSIFIFYKKTVIQPIFELTDAAWKIAQGYMEFKPKPTNRTDEIGQLTMAFSVMTDNLVSANEDLEKKVISRTKELERSNDDLEHFAYIASHDLQEPLRMIASYNQLLAKRYKDQLDDKAHKYIDYAVDGAKRMQALIHGLLEYSRAGSGGIEFKETDMNHQLDLVLHDLHKKIQETETKISKMELPSMVVNSQQVGRVLQNLISNAIKFQNGTVPKINISVKEESEETVFCIHDNGVGIAPESFDRVFNLFERVHSRQQYPGNGIGLAVSKRLVENHGGRIWLESEKDQGTAFYFSIPNDISAISYST